MHSDTDNDDTIPMDRPLAEVRDAIAAAEAAEKRARAARAKIAAFHQSRRVPAVW